MHGMPRNLVGTRHGWDRRTASTDAPPTSPHGLQSDTAGTTEPLPCKTRGCSDPVRDHSQTVYAHDLRCVTSLGTHTNWLRLTASWRSQFVRERELRRQDRLPSNQGSVGASHWSVSAIAGPWLYSVIRQRTVPSG